MLPDLLIIGAMRAGSSVLCKQLVRSGDISLSRPSQTNFFSVDSVWQRGLKWYESCFDHCPPGSVKTDASTTYARYPVYGESARRAAATCPDAKIIYLIRNPIDRAISHYRQCWFSREIPRYRTFGEFIREDKTAIQFGLYYEQLSHYLEYFSPERILVLLSENLFRDSPLAHRRVNAFLELGNEYISSDLTSQAGSRSWFSRRRWMERVRASRLIPQNLRKLIRPTKGRERYHTPAQIVPPRINLNEHRASLLEAFGPDVQKMSEFTGRDLNAFWAMNSGVRSKADTSS